MAIIAGAQCVLKANRSVLARRMSLTGMMVTTVVGEETCLTWLSNTLINTWVVSLIGMVDVKMRRSDLESKTLHCLETQNPDLEPLEMSSAMMTRKMYVSPTYVQTWGSESSPHDLSDIDAHWSHCFDLNATGCNSGHDWLLWTAWLLKPLSKCTSLMLLFCSYTFRSVEGLFANWSVDVVITLTLSILNLWSSRLCGWLAPSLGAQGRPSGQLQGEEPERKQDKQKESKASTSLWQPCWFRDSACTQRAHCEHGSTLYSCGVLTPTHTHHIRTETAHREGCAEVSMYSSYRFVKGWC